MTFVMAFVSRELSDHSQASRRVLGDAERRATARGDVAGPVDLIHALWADDSRAAELLQIGYDEATFHQDFQISSPTEVTSSLSPVIAEARRLARQQGRGVEVATEHLLAGLVAVHPEIGEQLAARGIDLSQIEHGLPQEGGAPEPLVVDAESHLSHVIATEDVATMRVLDAAANRCREGLRVVEDHVRFTLDDPLLSERLKTIRHELAGVLTSMGADNWIRARDTQGDVGTGIHTAAERSRASVAGLVAANCKRVEESLRTLEEYGKLQRTAAPPRLEALRYQFYTVEQALLARQHVNVRLEHAKLYLLLTDRLCPRGLGPVAHAAISAGVDVIQLREKETSERRRIDLAKRVREWTREADVLFIINDRPDIAALVDADGVHLGQDDMTVSEARRIVGTNKLIGVSTHTVEQAREAVLAGADYLGVGPVFASPTKEFQEFAGLDFVRAAATQIRISWFAIGGITEANIGEVMTAGATRVAVSSAICRADAPQLATSELIRKLSADSVQ